MRIDFLALFPRISISPHLYANFKYIASSIRVQFRQSSGSFLNSLSKLIWEKFSRFNNQFFTQHLHMTFFFFFFVFSLHSAQKLLTIRTLSLSISTVVINHNMLLLAATKLAKIVSYTKTDNKTVVCGRYCFIIFIVQLVVKQN